MLDRCSLVETTIGPEQWLVRVRTFPRSYKLPVEFICTDVAKLEGDKISIEERTETTWRKNFVSS